jgi:hypothetical protein
MNGSVQSDGLVVVHARDEVNQALTNHGGREYTSPPHHRADALALVALLLERPVQPDEDGQTSWTRPLAGGHRTITLDPVPAQPQPTGDNTTVTPTTPPRPRLADGAAGETHARPTDRHWARRRFA